MDIMSQLYPSKGVTLFMKKMYILLLFISFVLFMTSCGFSNNENVYDDHIKCDNLMTDLVNKLAEKDSESVKKFFAPKLYEIESFDDDLNNLINYYDGNAKSINGMVTTGDYANYNYQEKHHELVYSVVCEGEIFRFRILYIEKDSRNSKNIGISYLYILKKSEDEYPDLTYFGGLYPKDGIHVAYPHELPDCEE